LEIEDPEMKIHPKRRLLAGLADGFSAESRLYLAHAARCPTCRARLVATLEDEERPAAVLPWESQSGAGRRLETLAGDLDGQRAAFASEEAEAVVLLGELLAQSAERRALLLATQPRFWTWKLADGLVETARESSFRDPEGAERLAGLALGLAGHLPEPPYRGRRGDLLARAWASLGNARRLRYDLAGAESAFTNARSCLLRGSRNAMERASVADLESSLAIDQRRFVEAERLLARATATYREHGELHRAGRARIKMATVYSKAGEPELAIPLLRDALSLVEPGREPRLELAVRHNLATCLVEAGRALEARQLFAASRELYRRFAEPWAENRRRWLSGKIARGLGQTAEAEAALLAARDGFLADGVPYDTALITLEIAALYAEAGRTAELLRLAGESAPLFLSRQIHREALLALAFFRQAAEAEALTPGVATQVIAQVATYLKQAQDDPRLPFQA
jgi:tetratricopeptide (TPR) repeat protein